MDGVGTGRPTDPRKSVISRGYCQYGVSKRLFGLGKEGVIFS